MATSKTKDPYRVLGVARDADEDAIRSAYRKLARELHPDVNPDNPAAEERFKAVSEAYSVLSDPEKRTAYDEFGEVSFQPGFDAAEARRARDAFGGGFGGYANFGDARGGAEGFEDLLANIFGRSGPGRGARQRRGADLEASVELDFLDAARGCEQRFQVSRPSRDGGQRSESVTVRIPPGVADGGQIRLRGKGGEGLGGGPPGDLFVQMQVQSHAIFERDGRNLYCEVPINFAHAALGGELEVPTLEGRVKLKIPAETQTGKLFRLRGKGVKPARGGATGDLLCRVVVETPIKLNKRQKELLEEFQGTLSDTGTRHSPRQSSWFEGVKNFFDDMKI